MTALVGTEEGSKACRDWQVGEKPREGLRVPALHSALCYHKDSGAFFLFEKSFCSMSGFPPDQGSPWSRQCHLQVPQCQHRLH